MPTKKQSSSKTPAIRLDWTRDLNKAVERFLKDKTIAEYLEHGPDDIGLREVLLSQLINRKIGKRVSAIVRKRQKEASP